MHIHVITLSDNQVGGSTKNITNLLTQKVWHVSIKISRPHNNKCKNYKKGQKLQHITNETFQLQFNPRKLLKTPWPKKKNK